VELTWRKRLYGRQTDRASSQKHPGHTHTHTESERERERMTVRHRETVTRTSRRQTDRQTESVRYWVGLLLVRAWPRYWAWFLRTSSEGGSGSRSRSVRGQTPSLTDQPHAVCVDSPADHGLLPHAIAVNSVPRGPKHDTSFNYVDIMPDKLQNTGYLYCLNNLNVCN